MFRAHLSLLYSSPSLSRSPMPVCVCVRACVCSFFFCIYLHASRFSDFYTREQPMCNQKLPFVLLSVRFYNFFFFSRPHTQSSFIPQIPMFYRKYSYYGVFLNITFLVKKKKGYIYINIYKLLSACPTSPPLSPDSNVL